MSTSNRALRALFLLGVGLAFLGCGPQAQKPIERENDAAKTPVPIVVDEIAAAETPDPVVVDEVAVAETPDPVVVHEIAVAEASPQMKAPLQETRRRVDESKGDPPAFGDSLWNIWDELPLVRVTTGDRTGAWTKVRLNANGAGFDAVRFTNPLSSAADAFVVLALPGNPSFSAGVTANPSGVQPFNPYRKANLVLDDLDLPDRNEVYFFKLVEGVFRPGDEYCLWFTFLDSDPIDVYLMSRLVESVPNEQEPPADAADVAQKLGFELPFRHTKAAMAGRPGQAPSGMIEALEKAAQLVNARKTGTPEFAQTLESIKLGFAEIPPMVGDQDPGWTTVRLDAANLGFDVIRFSNPTDEPADMVWAFTLPEDVRVSWYIASATAPGSPGFRNFQSKACLDIPGLDLPERNDVTFQQLGGGRIHPGHDYFVWFRLQTPDPVDMQVKLRLLGPGEQAVASRASAESLAECLGLELPFRLTDAAPLTQRTQNLAESRGPDAALEFLEKELENTRDRAAEYFYVVNAHNYGMRLAKNDETRDRAVEYYFKAAKVMRRRSQNQKRLNRVEQILLRNVLYNEACGLALTGQPEKAAESLREAIQAGYDDRAHILADDDLREVRDLPVFDELIEEIDETPVATSPPALQELPEPSGEVSTPGLTPDEDGWILLPPLIQADRDTLDAHWTWDGQVATLAAGKPRAIISFPLRIMGSYELQFRVTIGRAKAGMTICLPVGDRRAVVVLMKGDDGARASPTATIELQGVKPLPQPHGAVSMKVGTESAFSCKVIGAGERVGVEIRRDGQVLFQWAGLLSQVDEMRDNGPAAVKLTAGYYSILEFRDLQLRMLAGQLTPTYPQ